MRHSDGGQGRLELVGDGIHHLGTLVVQAPRLSHVADADHRQDHASLIVVDGCPADRQHPESALGPPDAHVDCPLAGDDVAIEDAGQGPLLKRCVLAARITQGGMLGPRPLHDDIPRRWCLRRRYVVTQQPARRGIHAHHATGCVIVHQAVRHGLEDGLYLLRVFRRFPLQAPPLGHIAQDQHGARQPSLQVHGRRADVEDLLTAVWETPDGVGRVAPGHGCSAQHPRERPGVVGRHPRFDVILGVLIELFGHAGHRLARPAIVDAQLSACSRVDVQQAPARIVQEYAVGNRIEDDVALEVAHGNHLR